MSQFMFLYRDAKRPTGSPQEMQQQMQKWMAWLKELTDKGHVNDPGHPLESTGKVVKGASKDVTDGPFAEAKDVVGGYTLVEAADINHAAELTKGCPIFGVGGYVEVRPVMKVG